MILNTRTVGWNAMPLSMFNMLVRNNAGSAFQIIRVVAGECLGIYHFFVMWTKLIADLKVVGEVPLLQCTNVALSSPTSRRVSLSSMSLINLSQSKFKMIFRASSINEQQREKLW